MPPLAELREVATTEYSHEALALANARLRHEVERRQRIASALVRRHRELRDDLRLAAEFQRSVLPVLPVLDYLAMDVRLRPCRAVSGDVYDVHLNREGEVGVFVGDATGHGLPAAFMTMLIHSGLDNLRRDLATDETLVRLNRLLCERPTGRAVSAVYFRISRSGTLAVTHAGHPSLIVVPATRRPPVGFREGGCALGIFADEPVPYREEHHVLEPGDTVLAYTDGVLESRDAGGRPFGESRLLETLDAARHLAPAQLVEHVLAEVGRHCRSLFCDDVTVFACRYTGGLAPGSAGA